jgi:cell division protease FtsH
MVSIFGMSEKVGNVSYYDSTGQSDYSFSKPYSEKTAELIDEEVKIIIDGQYQRALQILKDNAEGHKKLADLLLKREVIFSEDLEKIFGKRPWDKKHVISENGNGEEKALEEKTEAEGQEKAESKTEKKAKKTVKQEISSKKAVEGKTDKKADKE